MAKEYSNYSLQDYLVLFQNTNVQLNGIDSRVNFMDNSYTISDITKCKDYLKMTLNNKPGSNVIRNTDFLNKGQQLLTENLMQRKLSNSTTSVFVKPVKPDNILNGLEKNTYDNMMNIDTRYMVSYNFEDNYSKALENKNNMIVKLTQPVNNVVELSLNSIQLPYTFYNISEKRNNNYFYIYLNSDSNSVYEIRLEDGHYENVDNLLTEINNKINDNGLDTNEIYFEMNNNTKKIKIVNTSSDDIHFEFFQSNNNSDFGSGNNNNYSQLQKCLGWFLGCRNIQSTPDFISSDQDSISLIVEVKKPSSPHIFQAMPMVPNQKYFILCIDDFTKSQNDKNLIEINNMSSKIKPKIYPMDDKNMNCITCDNDSNYQGKYTKAEKYSQIEILKNQRNNSNIAHSENINVNQVLAIIPFDTSSAKFSTTLSFNNELYLKKNRKYFGPVDITKIKFTLYDDYGDVIDFNGYNWNFSLVATSLYKL
tara:strand:+ start:4553 stop:5989 length:1437 start_codon:yes stop_codon:yes gene_type:complete